MNSCRLLLTATTAATARGGGGSVILRPHRFTAATASGLRFRPQQQSPYSSTTQFASTCTPGTIMSWTTAVQRSAAPTTVGTVGCFSSMGGGCVMIRTQQNGLFLPVFPIAGAQSLPLPFPQQQQQQQQVRLKHSIKTNKSVSKRFRTRGNGSLKR
jgi:hypothetical protein